MALHFFTQSRSAGVVFAALAFSAVCWGQRNTGTISGHVTDPNGAAMPSISVTLVQPATGSTQTTATNQEGFYMFPAVAAGKYQLKAQSQGFRTYELRDIEVQVNQNLTLPVQMQLGEVVQAVEVSASAAAIDTVSGSVKQAVEARRITELPLNGRNVLQFQQLVPGAVFTGSGDQFGNTPAFMVNGGASFSNTYTLDGGEHTDSFFNSAITFPNPDAIQEFSIQTSTYSAEFGRNRGASVNAVTRSGTNQFHGTLFEFVRNNAFDARNFFAVNKPPYKRNQFGATVGGPIQKNKQFFFFAWESTRERGSTGVATFLSPSAAMRRGDFSELNKTIRDPLTGEAFAGGVIPASRLSQPALNFLDKYSPLPNSDGLLFSGERRTTFDRDQYTGRYDLEISSNHRLFARYMWNGDTSLVNRGSFTDWYQDQDFTRQTVTIGDTYTFTPTLLNNFTFTFNRVGHLIDILPKFSWSELGAKFPNAAPGDQKGWAEVNLPGYFNAVNGVPWDVSRNTFNYANTTSWVRGGHTVKFGGQVSHYQMHQLFEWLSAGAMTFNGQFSGDAASDFLLGNIFSLRQGSPGFNDLRQTLWGFFVNDDWRATPRLTLNLGLRYEPYLGFRELNGKIVAFRPGQQSTVFPTAPAGLLFQGDRGIHDNLTGSDWNNFSPRAGFAWDVFGNQRLAVRGGYGVFYDAMAGIRLNRFPYNQPFMLDLTMNDLPLDEPYRNLAAAPFPYVTPTTPEERNNFRFVVPGNVTSANENMVTPYTQQWNLTFETQLPAKLTVSAGYVGSKSSKLFGSRNINPALWRPGATVRDTQQRRIYPQYALIEDAHTTGYSQYHSLQVVVNRRLSKGLTFTSNYTLSKNTGYTGSQGEGSVGTRNALNHRMDDGILALDVTHLSSTSLVWDIPAVTQQRFLGHVLNGWQSTGILQLQSGFPFTVRSGVDNSFSGQGLDTADLAGTPGYTSGTRGDRLAKWFNTEAFTVNAPGTFGNVGINTMRGPGLWYFDLGMFKNFAIAEQKALQFRAQFFNLFNNPNFGLPNSTVNNRLFGRIISTTGNPRQIEFGLKFRW